MMRPALSLFFLMYTQMAFATGRIVFSLASGVMMRPALSLFFLMYTQMAFVTSVRGITFLPTSAARAGDSVFGAKIPKPFFFMSAARLAPAAFIPADFRLPFFFGAFVAFLITFFTAFFADFFAILAAIAEEMR